MEFRQTAEWWNAQSPVEGKAHREPCSLEWFDALMYRIHHAEEALAAKADGQSPEE